jgi:hypothetical protein
MKMRCYCQHVTIDFRSEKIYFDNSITKENKIEKGKIVTNKSMRRGIQCQKVKAIHILIEQENGSFVYENLGKNPVFLPQLNEALEDGKDPIRVLEELASR